MPLRARLPDPLAHIFAPHPILPENTILETEDPQSIECGEVQVRALNGFLFVKNGRFVYPTYNEPDGWWTGVLAFGYVAALTGDYKHFIWAGDWNEDYDGKHLEVMILANLRGLSKERSIHWRHNSEHILWLETEQGYTYVLLEPAQEYDRGGWTRVLDSWTELPHKRRRQNPRFIPLGRQDPRPNWWRKEGDDAWEHWVGDSETKAARVLARAAQSVQPLAASKDSTTEKKPTVFGRLNSKPSGKRKAPAKISIRDRVVAGTSISRKSQHAQVEPIYVESSSSEEEAPAHRSSQPSPAASQVHDHDSPNERPRRSTGTIEPASVVCKESNNIRGPKRRVVSGASETRDRQKRKTVGHIDLTSEPSDTEELKLSQLSAGPARGSLPSEAASSPTHTPDLTSLGSSLLPEETAAVPESDGGQACVASNRDSSSPVRLRSDSPLVDRLQDVHIIDHLKTQGCA